MLFNLQGSIFQTVWVLFYFYTFICFYITVVLLLKDPCIDKWASSPALNISIWLHLNAFVSKEFLRITVLSDNVSSINKISIMGIWTIHWGEQSSLSRSFKFPGFPRQGQLSAPINTAFILIRNKKFSQENLNRELNSRFFFFLI